MKKYALFDVDSLEYSQNENKLLFRPRVKPIIPKLEELYDFAETNSYPLIFTNCCSGGLLTESTEDILLVPLEKEKTGWKDQLNDFNKICLQKKTFGVPEINSEKCAFNVFTFNENAVEALTTIDAQEWLIFGNGFDACINSTILGMVKAGLNLTLLEDVFVRGSFKYLNDDPEIHKNNLLNMFRAKGVKIESFERLIK